MFEQSFGKSYLSPTVVAPKLTENPTSSRHHSVLSLPPEGELRRDGIQLQCTVTDTQFKNEEKIFKFDSSLGPP